MRLPVFISAVACLLLPMLLVSCHTSRQAVSRSGSSRPKFIDNVYIAPHNSSNVTEDAIDHRHKAPARPKQGPAKPIAASSADVNTRNNKNDDADPINLHVKPGKVNKVAPPAVVKKKYSQMLGVPPKRITNYTLYQFIDKWYGTDYRLGGCDKSGIDCSGFAQRLYDEVYGVDLERTAKEQFINCKRIKRSKDASEGDLVFFHIHSKHITHVGVYLANDYFVHASSSGGVMISNLNEEYWRKYYAGCGRVPRD